MRYWQGIIFLIKKPFRLFFLIAGLTLFFGLSQLHTAYVEKDNFYTEATGEICNVTSKKLLLHGRYVTRYWYDLRWYADGEIYEEHFEEQFYCRPEGKVNIWVSKNNRDALFAKPKETEEIINHASEYIFVSVVTGLIAIVLYWIHVLNRRESREEKMERLLDNKIGSIIMFVCCLIVIGLCAVDIYKDYQKGEMISTALIDMLIAFIVIAIICVIIFFVSKKQSDVYDKA